VAHIIYALAIFFSLRPVRSSTAVSVPTGVAAPNLLNHGLHSVFGDFILINYARTLVSDLLLIFELI